MEQTFKIMLARFPGGNAEHPAEVNWIINTLLFCKDDPRIGGLEHWFLNDTPVTMSRNRCIREAIAKGVDILLMVDSDMGPDLINAEHWFWPAAFDFMVSRWHEAPTIIAAPYCGPPPHENVYIFRWRKYQSNHSNPDYKLDQFTREEAAERSGIEAVAALPTGLIAIDMRVFTGFKVGDQVLKLPTPWFYYEWTDEYQSHKASTEDVTFTRDVHILFSAHGLETIFVDWDAWAVHFKEKGVPKPALINPGGLARLFQQRSAEIPVSAHAPAAQANNGHIVGGLIAEAETAVIRSEASIELSPSSGGQVRAAEQMRLEKIKKAQV